ncbi:MAG: response regulator transcription factor [Pseudomonadota bacterium]
MRVLEQQASEAMRELPVPIRTFVVEDDPEMLDVLSSCVREAETLELAGTAADVPTAIKKLPLLSFDLLLVDLQLEDRSGVEVIRACRARTKAKILVISVLGDERNVVRAIEAGADGYILKDDAFTDLTASIERAFEGDAPLSPAVARHLLRMLQSDGITSKTPEAQNVGLSNRELQVLEAFAQGYSYKDVARQYDLSYHTVTDYVKSLYKKLQVTSRSQAVARAAQAGLIDLSKAGSDSK